MRESVHSSSTIFALTTGVGRSAIAVMRVSGPGSFEILQALCHGERPAIRKAVLKKLYNPADSSDVIDHALVLAFKGPASYTGEDSVEFHLHASPAIIEAMADSLISLGARPAEAGEFSKRAFVNGKLDLVQAEGIADLIAAETQQQRRQALWQAEGRLSLLYQGWSERLKKVLAWQEALIDFPDEDLPEETERLLKSDIAHLKEEMAHHLNDNNRGERIRDGVVVSIVGSPNVGKSSLLNHLAGRPAAIVSSQAGTTRDAVEIRLVIGGVPVSLVDTAGLRETHDEIEVEGIKRSHAYIKKADLVIHVKTAADNSHNLELLSENILQVYNKIDITPAPEGVLGISILEKKGLEEFYETVQEKIKAIVGNTTSPPLTRARHRVGIESAYHHLLQAESSVWPETRGEELRLALQALGRITGKIGVEDILDSIFGDFCIGK